MQFGSLTVDSTGVVTSADPRAMSLLALTSGECLNRPLGDVLQFSAENHQRFADFLHSKKTNETLGQWPEDGLGRAVRLHVLRCVLPADVAVTMQYRCQLSIRNDAIVERTALAAVQLRSTIQSIIAGFAHEVRNPLAAILSIIESAIQKNEASAVPSEDLKRIPALVGRIESLIRQAHDYSRPAQPVKKEAAPSIFIKDAIEMVQSRYKHITIQRDLDEALPQVHIDVRQVERTLINLLDNACYAARSRVTVVARRTRTSSTVVIEVRDDGPGIAENVAPRIFEPFFTTKATGTGLGLALARDLARMNGGDLRLHHSSTEGTVFRLLLPTRPKAAAIKSAS